MRRGTVSKKTEEEPFSLVKLPNYVYPLNIACPSCYRPLESRKRRDGRCMTCLRSKNVLPVNYLHEKKRKDSEEEENERKNRRRYNRDED